MEKKLFLAIIYKGKGHTGKMLRFRNQLALSQLYKRFSNIPWEVELLP